MDTNMNGTGEYYEFTTHYVTGERTALVNAEINQLIEDVESITNANRWGTRHRMLVVRFRTEVDLILFTLIHGDKHCV